MTNLIIKLKRIFNCDKIQVMAVNPQLEDRNYKSYNKNTHTFDGKKLPDCIDDKGHYFKTCDRCSHMVCRRCNTTSYDFLLSLCSTYGDFSGTMVEYDRYCDKCEQLVKRASSTVYPRTFKSYEDWEQHRIVNNDTLCKRCDGHGLITKENITEKCMRCEGTGKFPSPSRIKHLKKVKKEKEKYPKILTKLELFLDLFRL